ncbi:Non-histone protein 10 [Choanephora cucurbitarum]|uniref:Non-histone protein 10 n=1 Tax=Choanephora cucurbitarum TaxID=101091 RepID=A0A1C7MUK1_9FUNG|nr:Non-histone protein 10 [Choanephora cucurbitarum]
MTEATDPKYRQKFKDLKKRIREIEEENDLLNIKLYKARKNIRHLKLERTFLLDRMEKSSQISIDLSDNSDLGSEIYYHDEPDMHLHKIQSSHKHDGRGRIEKLMAGNNKPQRKKKDPNAPKGPGNVFFLYCRLERDKIKDEHPTENLGEVTRLLGQKWKSLTKEEKKKYYDMYKRELEEYEEAMKTYTLNGGVAPAASNSIGNEDAGMVSIVSSPAQTEMSMDFTSDHVHHHDSPEASSFMDEDMMAPPPQSEIYGHHQHHQHQHQEQLKPQQQQEQTQEQQHHTHHQQQQHHHHHHHHQPTEPTWQPTV